MTLTAFLSLCFVCLNLPGLAPTDVGLRVSLRTLDAEEFSATLTGLTSDAIHVLVDGEARTIATDDVLQLRPVDSAGPASAGAEPNRIVCHLVDGGMLAGGVENGAATGTVHLRVREGLIVEIPLMYVAAIRFGNVDDKQTFADFESRRAERKPGRDVLLLLREGHATAVPGALEGLSPAGWAFRFGGKTRNGAFTGAYGVVLGSAALRDGRGPIAVTFGDGNHVYGRIVKADDAALDFDVGAIGRLSVPWAAIRNIDFASGRVVRLSELTPVHSTCESIVGGRWTAQRNHNVTGGPLRIGSRAYEDGWGVHATSRLEFEVGDQYGQLVADVGIDASVGTRGSAIFRVIADGKTLYETDVRRGGQAAARIKVNLGHVSRLVLECDRADGLDLSDHGNWANAYLVRRKEPDAS